MSIYQVDQDIWVPVVLIDPADRLSPVESVASTYGTLQFSYGVLDGTTTWTDLSLSSSNWKEKGDGQYLVKLLGATENDTAGILSYACIDTAGAAFLPYYNNVDVVNHAPASAIATLTTRLGTPSSDIATELAATFDEAEIARKVATNRWKITNKILIIYDDDATTPLYQFSLLDSAGDPTDEEPFERSPI